MHSMIQKLERLTLRRKISLSYALVVLFAVGIGTANLLVQRQITTDIEQLYTHVSIGVSNAKGAQIDLLLIATEIRQAVLVHDTNARDASLETINIAQQSLQQRIPALWPADFGQVTKKNLSAFEGQYQKYKANVDKVIYLLKTGHRSQAEEFLVSDEFRAAGKAANLALKQLSLESEIAAQATTKAAISLRDSSLRRNFLFLFLGLTLVSLLGHYIANSIRRPIKRLQLAVQDIAKGNLTADIPYLKYENEIGSLARSVHVLQLSAQALEREAWIENGISNMSSVLQGIEDYELFGQRLATQLHDFLKFNDIAIYVLERQDTLLRPLNIKAAPENKNYSNYYKIGEGPVGKCAQNRLPIIVMVGLGTHVLLPILRNDRLMGVFELNVPSPLGTSELAFLNRLLPVIAVNMEILERGIKTNNLLLETKSQAESLQAQAKTLHTQNEFMQATKSWYRGVINSAPDGLLVANNDGIIVIANPLILELFGYHEKEVVGHAIEMLVPLDYRESYVSQFQAYMRKSYADDVAENIIEIIGLRRNGTEFPAEVKVSRLPTFDDSGIFVCASVHDLTGRKQAEQATRSQTSFLKSLLDTFPHPVFYKGPDTRFLGFNDAYLRTFGVELSDLVGKTVLELSYLSEEDREAYQAEDQQIIATAGQVQKEMIIPFADGKLHNTLYSVRGFRQPDGSPGGLVGTFADITPMVEARRLAEEATKAKSDFLANMSHEIRTPLNAIIGMSYLALQGNPEKKQKNYVEKINRAGEHLLRIVNDILDFSKIEAGQMRLETIDFVLEDVLDNLSNLVSMKAQEKGLELVFVVDDDVHTSLRGDPLRLGQILTNLVNNAIKFTDSGVITVSIEKMNEVNDQVELHFSVKDTGIGITQEQLARLFRSFTQADTSTTRKYGGTGLGLAISKTLVELMRGRIWAVSTSGGGTVMHFHAWFGVCHTGSMLRIPKKLRWQGLRMLVVDSIAASREVLANTAKALGMEVDTAEDTESMQSKINTTDIHGRPIALVLVNSEVPGWNWNDFIHQFRRQGETEIPLIVIGSAIGQQAIDDYRQKSGLTVGAILSKPITLSGLSAAVDEVIDLTPRLHQPMNSLLPPDVVSKLAGSRVLLVEDNELNQELALELLATAHMEIVVAKNGQEALDILELDSDFDGILMDCQMPVMDGYTATQEIQKNSLLINIPVIAMTANLMTDDTQKALETGMCDCIFKPLRVNDMFLTLSKWIYPRLGRVERSKKYTMPVPRLLTKVSEIEAAGIYPGIDVAAGLSVSLGDEALFKRLLTRFRDSHAEFQDLLTKARIGDDPTAPVRLAHTLRGIAGNIGAHGIEAAAVELEYAFRHGATDEEIDSIAQRVNSQIAPVIEGINAALPPPGRTVNLSTESEPDTASIEAALKQLKTLLRESDANDTLEVMERLLELGRGTAYENRLVKVARLVSDFDFDMALMELDGEVW